MRLINENEIRRMKTWAVEHARQSFPGEESRDDANSYWESREKENSYIMEYQFDTVSEWEALCDSVLHRPLDEYIRKTTQVAVFKNIPGEEDSDVLMRSSGVLEYIYML